MKLNAKQMMLSLKSNPVLKSKLNVKPKIAQHLKRYPNMKFKKGTIIDIDYKVGKKITFGEEPVKLNFKPVRAKTFLKEVK